MKLSKIELFYNTPFTDFQNTIHFKSNAERDKFFDNTYSRYSFKTQFNFIKDRLVLRANVMTEQTYGLNYMRFTSPFEDGRTYYCYIMETNYINNNTTEFGLVMDVIMTFCQGDISRYLKNIYLTRQTITQETQLNNKRWLQTNDDVLKFPKTYRHQSYVPWRQYYVIFCSSVDLTSDFGTEKNPKLKTSKGQTYDGVVSPLDLYVCKSLDQFNKVTTALSDYPWISQNLSNIAIVPGDLVDNNDLKPEENIQNDRLGKAQIFRFKDGAKTKTTHLDGISVGEKDMIERMGYDKGTPPYLLREEYSNIELDTWDGQRISIDPTFLPANKLDVYAQSMFGYHNEIRVIVDQYKSSENENSLKGLYRGTYANHAIILTNFDDIPILVDNYKLQKAETAHVRELNNQRQPSARWREITKSNDSLKDKFANAISLTSSLAGGVIKNALGMFTDEYEYYRTQKAELADKAISAPSVGNQNNSQSFNISAGIFGVTLKYSSIGSGYAKRIRRYHNTFGFDFQNQIQDAYSIESLPVMNYLKCTGNYVFPNVPSQFMQQIKATLENGVKFWVNKDNPNPFNQDLLENEA